MAEPQCEANKQVVRRYFEFLNGGDAAALDEIIAPTIVEHSYFGTVSLTVEALRERVTRDRKGVPDLRFVIEEEICEGERVVVAWRASGVQTGEFMGVVITGNYASVTGILIARVVDGKITEVRNEWDRLGALQQLGIIQSR